MYMATGSPFETASPHQAIAVLLLVENSQPMSFIWPDLRDLYLTKLVDNIEKTTAPTPIISLVLESYPSQGTQASFPRQYNGLHEGLRDLRFNGSPDNKLNVAKISTGIDCLISVESQGRPAALHLIIVAASTPSDDGMGGGNSFSTWSLLAQKMAQANIHCHVVMSPNEDMTSLTFLFEETVSIETCVSDDWRSDFSNRTRSSYLPSISSAKSSPVLSGRSSHPQSTSKDHTLTTQHISS